MHSEGSTVCFMVLTHTEGPASQRGEALGKRTRADWSGLPAPIDCQHTQVSGTWGACKERYTLIHNTGLV